MCQQRFDKSLNTQLRKNARQNKKEKRDNLAQIPFTLLGHKGRMKFHLAAFNNNFIAEVHLHELYTTKKFLIHYSTMRFQII